MFCPWISIANHWQLKLFFILSSFPPLLYSPWWLLRIWPVPHWNLLFWFTPCLLDVGIVEFNILEFIFMGDPPWTSPPVHICLFLWKLVKASHFPSELWSSALEHAQLHAPSVPFCTGGPKSSEGVGCATVFPDFDVFIYSCSWFNFYSGVMCYIPHPFLYFIPRQW